MRQVTLQVFCANYSAKLDFSLKVPLLLEYKGALRTVVLKESKQIEINEFTVPGTGKWNQ